MIFSEFIDKIFGTQVETGDRAWICDFRHDDINNKAIRHIRPQEVVIVDNNDLPPRKVVYYSPIHFRPIGKNGEPKQQIIAPFDNTGFRGRTGNGIHIFDNREECVKEYKRQCEVVRDQIKTARVESMRYYDILDANLQADIDKL